MLEKKEKSKGCFANDSQVSNWNAHKYLIRREILITPLNEPGCDCISLLCGFSQVSFWKEMFASFRAFSSTLTLGRKVLMGSCSRELNLRVGRKDGGEFCKQQKRTSFSALTSPSSQLRLWLSASTSSGGLRPSPSGPSCPLGRNSAGEYHLSKSQFSPCRLGMGTVPTASGQDAQWVLMSRRLG